MILLTISLKWMLPVALNLVFIGLSIIIAYLHTKNAPFWNLTRKIAEREKMKRQNHKLVDELEQSYEDAAKNIELKLSQKAQAAAAEQTKTEQSSLQRAKETIINLENYKTAMNNHIDRICADGKYMLNTAFIKAKEASKRRKKRRFLTLLLLILMPALFSGCNEANIIHHKVILLDISGSNELTETPEQIANLVLGKNFQTNPLYEDGIVLTVALIGNWSQSKKVVITLPCSDSYLSVDEEERKATVRQFYKDVVAAITDILSISGKRPSTYIHRGIANVKEELSYPGAQLFIYSDCSQENPYSGVIFPDIWNKYHTDFMSQYDVIAQALKKDAEYRLDSTIIHVIYTPDKDDEYYRCCKSFFEQFWKELGCTEIKFQSGS